jgi:hypothetical protein
VGSRPAAESPAGIDEAGDVTTLGVGELVDVVAGDAGGGVPGGLGALGGVLGKVARDHAVGDLAGAGEGDGPDVDELAFAFVAPDHGPAVRWVGVGRGGEAGRGGGVDEDLDEVVERDGGRRREDGAGVGGVDAVEADQDVEVDGAAALHLGGLAVRQPDRRHTPDLAVRVDEVREGDAAGTGEFAQGAFGGLLVRCHSSAANRLNTAWWSWA